MENVVLGFVFTLIAGLATGLGSLVVFFMKDFNKKVFSFMLGLSAGVMIYISFVEMLRESEEIFAENFAGKGGEFFNIVFFFAGMAVIALIDNISSSIPT